MAKKLENMTTLELIATVEAKNHRFKIAGSVFAGCIAIGLVILLILGLSTLDGVNTQLAQQKQLLRSQQQVLDKINFNGKQRTAQINDLQNHIDCIVELFRQPNRQSLTIKDLNSCEFDSNGNIITPSGGSNVPQKTTNTTSPSNNNGNSAGSAPVSQPAKTPSQPKVVPSTLNNLFCAIRPTNLTCSN